MNEQRRRAYLNLIDFLLDSPAYSLNILEASPEVLDYDLVETMEEIAVHLAKQGEIEKFALLYILIIPRVKILVTSKQVLPFLYQVLPATQESPREMRATVVYPILEANLDKLNDDFAEVLTYWANDRLLTTESDQALSLALTIDLFSDLMREFPKGDKGSNLEIAIAGYEIASSVYTQNSRIKSWAMAQQTLGLAYRNRLRGDWEENIEKAITCYQNCLQFYTRQAFPSQWAYIQTNLGVAYAFRLKSNNNNSQNQQIPKETKDLIYQRRLRGVSLAEIARLTGASGRWIQSDSLQENLEQAITCFQDALEVHTRNSEPKQWAMLQYNLGRAYDDLRTVGEDYEAWAEICEKAINCYEKALKGFTQQVDSLQWGYCHYNLGNAYNERTQGDPAENQEKAVKHHQEALLVRTYNNYPLDWAATQKSLGNAYLDSIFGDRENNIELAIEAYQEALRIYTPDNLPEDWTRVQYNLGRAYLTIASANQDENLQKAIACFQNSLKFCNREITPEKWADYQTMLAKAYWKSENFETAISLLQEVLQVCTREAYPRNWAMAHNALGLCYQKLQQIPQSIESFQLASEILTPTAFPQHCIINGRSLGKTAFEVKQWSIAIKAYSQAIEALEKTRGWATAEFRRVEILKEDIDIYSGIVEAYINNGQLEKAFEYAERSRGKRLVDLMATNHYQNGNIPPDVKKLNDQYEAKQGEIDNIYNQNHKQMERDSNSSTQAAIATNNPEDIERLEIEKQKIWEQLRESDFVLAAQKQVSIPKFEDIKQLKLIDDSKTALLSFYTTSENTYIFVLRETGIQLHTCTGQGIENLQAWIGENWLSVYKDDNSTWKNNISDFLKELAQRLQLTQLINEHLQGIEELILVPHIYLHLIPFAALPIGENKYLGDKFLIRYAPSCQVLDFCKKRPSVETFHETSLLYGTVEDATDDLPCVSFECEEIAKLYKIPDKLRLKGSRQATKDNYRQLVKQDKVQVLHSSHHAASNLEQPLSSILLLAHGETLTLGELLTPNWRVPDLLEVFLSCCETNLGNPHITDDILTIGFGFLCAGARSVISTLWSVDELATAIFCILYYQYRKQGMSRPAALQKAQQELRNLTGKNFESRYKQNLAKMLDEKLPQAEATFKEAQNEMMKYPKNSPDYLEWQQEWAKRFKIVTKIKNANNRLTSLCSEEYPFSHLMYWAGFTCSGLR
ncbi:CHAT domain-containing protein [Argonema antarcticum]|uniref:CHAT domain-containing protein n=1 Tax=Argonema antarcticum TaxID=2942763 RepID=UPI002011ABD1|nr:CHAT domain-containing protein [Argonema antarcticum]MCL1475158.1 CHAT domain-containing protein [Argonema antarcticum A004/B2]